MQLRVPPPPAVFVGRDGELGRLRVGLARVSVAVICGVAGVGKSALASTFAASWGGPVAYGRVGSAASLAELYDDVVRELGGRREGDAAAGVARMLDEHGALWVLDDLHRLAVADQLALVRELGGRLRVGKLVATSRQLLPFDASGPDRLEIKLGGLDSTSAQALWCSLDELHGATPGFESLWAQARGNPLLLRQAHACRPLAEDHIAAAVAALAESERAVALAMASCELPLPTRVVEALAADGRAALAGLVTRMIADPAGPGLWQLHDLFREALLAGAEPAQRERVHDQLARLLHDAPELDPVLRVREVCRHLRALDRTDECASYLLAQEPMLLREGATGDLLRALEALPIERCPPIVTVTLARTRARMLELERATRDLERLIAREPIAEAYLVLGQVAMLRGELATAAGAFAAIEQRADASSLVRQLALISAAITDAHRGDGERGRERIARAERAATDADELGVLVLMRGFLVWLDELDDQLEAMLRPNEWFSGCVAALRANVVAPGLAAALCARLGRLDEAEQHFAQASAALRRDDDLLSRVTLAYTRAAIDLERGERVAAEQRLREILADPRLHPMGVLMCNALRVRVLLALGRNREARELAAATGARAAELGVASITGQLARSREHDVVGQLARPAMKPWGGHAIRARALAAVRAAATGAPVAFEPPEIPGYGVERALARIAAALTARLDGREPDANAQLARAAAQLAGDGGDPELVPQLLDAVGRIRAITPRERRMVADAPPPAAIVVDARSHEIRRGAVAVSLRSRPLLGKLLLALASKPNTTWSKDAIAQLLWGTPFDPLVHDNSLKVSITRARALIGDGVVLEFDADGYRLAVPESFLYLDTPGSNPE